MLTISRSTGSVSDAIASLRDVPARVMPYASATALTRTVKLAQTEVVSEMPRAFSQPAAYTLNATRIEPASKDKLSARIAVKDQGSGVPQENFLFPQVAGGQRRAKGLEVGLRNAGLLRGDQFAMPGPAASLDASGNVRGADVRTLLRGLESVRSKPRDAQGHVRGKKLANSLFVGKPRGGTRADGIWRREGKRLRLLFVFTSNAPDYSRRLNFDGVVQTVVLERFSIEFHRAVREISPRFQ